MDYMDFSYTSFRQGPQERPYSPGPWRRGVSWMSWDGLKIHGGKHRNKPSISMVFKSMFPIKYCSNLQFFRVNFRFSYTLTWMLMVFLALPIRVCAFGLGNFFVHLYPSSVAQGWINSEASVEFLD